MLAIKDETFAGRRTRKAGALDRDVFASQPLEQKTAKYFSIELVEPHREVWSWM
ncbi:MAG: hypothetical protein ACJ788_02225 [Ktedonobacteraceae bacterium]|jgi:hypothetical protein